MGFEIAQVVGELAQVARGCCSCSVCTELVRDPVTLTCDHTYCRRCITSVAVWCHRSVQKCQKSTIEKLDQKQFLAEIIFFGAHNIFPKIFPKIYDFTTT